MRLSTLYMFKQSAESMSKRVSDNNNIYLQLSAGKSLLRASDDPKSATDAVNYQDALAKLELYSNVRSTVRSSLEHEDNILNGVGNLLTTTLTEKTVAAKTESYSDEDRRALGAEIKGIRGNLMDLANNRDGSGRYILADLKAIRRRLTMRVTMSAVIPLVDKPLPMVRICRRATWAAMFSGIYSLFLIKR